MITKTLTLINGATSTVTMPVSAITFQAGTKFAVVSGTTFPINVPIGGQEFVQVEFDNLVNTGNFAETATVVVDGFANITVAITATDEAVDIVLTVPDAITTLTGTNGDAQTVLAWTDPSDGGSVITGFNIRQDGTIVGNLVASSPQTILGLTNGTSYNFDVRAVNSIGEALSSNIATVIPQVAGVATDTRLLLDIFGDGSGVFAYPMDGNANDLGGNFNGIESASVTYITGGKFGQQFDATLEDASIQTTFTQPALTAYTHSIWTTMASGATGFRFMFGDNTSTNDATARMLVGLNNSDNFYLAMGDGTNAWADQTVTATSLLDGTLHHLVVSINLNTVKLYIDKVLIATLTTTVSAGTAGQGQYIIGQAGATTGIPWDDALSYHRMINKEVTQAEVDILFDESRP